MDPPPVTPDPTTKGVVGIQNMGNTCYCNTTLQLIRACPEWTVFCLTDKLASRVAHLPPENPHRRILMAYQDILCSLWSAHRPAYIRPIGFLTEIRRAVAGTPYEMFGLPIPNDSHEYLVYLLDQFHEAMRTDTPWTAEPVLDTDTEADRMRTMALNGWNAFLSKNNSPIVHFFFGMMRKTIYCTHCRHKTYQWEVFNSLKIPCEGKTLEEWIQKEANEESEIDGYRCEKCKEKRLAKLFSHIWHLPSHLFLTLRRFQPDGRKNMTPSPYQGHPITLRPFFASESVENSKEWSYELRGISDHHGTHMGGHYTAQIKHPITGQWWWMDDERAQPKEGPLCNASNYIYYFRRIAE